eukprot:6203404-Pleurochrysis_carterae.AAC.2
MSKARRSASNSATSSIASNMAVDLQILQTCARARLESTLACGHALPNWQQRSSRKGQLCTSRPVYHGCRLLGPSKHRRPQTLDAVGRAQRIYMVEQRVMAAPGHAQRRGKAEQIVACAGLRASTKHAGQHARTQVDTCVR